MPFFSSKIIPKIPSKPAPIAAKPAPIAAKPMPMPTVPMSKVQTLANTFRGGAPAPTIPSAPNKPPAGYADDLAGIYAAAKNKPQIFGPQAPMPSGGPKPVASTMAAPTTAAKPVPLNPNYMKKGGKASSASKRGDGIAQRGKTKGRMI